MEECYKYFDCSKSDCPAYGKKNIKCWEIEATLCHHAIVEYFQSQLSEVGQKKCEACVYYVTKAKGWNLTPDDTIPSVS